MTSKFLAYAQRHKLTLSQIVWLLRARRLYDLSSEYGVSEVSDGV